MEITTQQWYIDVIAEDPTLATDPQRLYDAAEGWFAGNYGENLTAEQHTIVFEAYTEVRLMIRRYTTAKATFDPLKKDTFDTFDAETTQLLQDRDAERQELGALWQGYEDDNFTIPAE